MKKMKKMIRPTLRPHCRTPRQAYVDLPLMREVRKQQRGILRAAYTVFAERKRRVSFDNYIPWSPLTQSFRSASAGPSQV
jgi:hypothetical protein